MNKGQNRPEELNAYFDSLPIRLKPTIKMERPNSPIPIHNGLVTIRYQNKSIECNVNILFTWLPRRGVEFTIEDNHVELFNLFSHHMVDSSLISFEIDGFEIGQTLCMNVRENGRKYFITGLINPPFIQYTNPTGYDEVDKVSFHLFNFINIHGTPVRKDSRRRGILARMVFPMDRFEIVVDTILDNLTQWSEVTKQGGYGLTHVGELISKSNEKLDKDRANIILDRFGLFLSFLAGRKIAPFFMAGKKDGEVSWIEYNNYSQEPYRYLDSWLPQLFDEKIGALWLKFYRLCQDKYDLDTLHLVIHWYLSANKDSGGLEGAIILLQNAFELLFRWIVVERENMVSPDGGEALRASDKIRMLLYLIKCDTDLPAHYQDQFEDFIKEDPSLTDFPYWFTEIRNSYVHSSRKKREKINRLPNYYLNTILACGLYYVELLLLYLLDYEGKIAQRISTQKLRGADEVFVPWFNGRITKQV